MDKLWKKTSSSHPNLKKLCAVAAESAAPQFYITPKQALEKYGEFKRTGKVDVASSVTSRMYMCIFNKYDAAVASGNGTDFKYSIMQDVLESEAPSFFISPTAAIAFYYRAMAYKRKLSKQSRK